MCEFNTIFIVTELRETGMLLITGDQIKSSLMLLQDLWQHMQHAMVEKVMQVAVDNVPSFVFALDKKIGVP